MPFITDFDMGYVRRELDFTVPRKIYDEPEKILNKLKFRFFSEAKEEDYKSFFSDLNKTIKNYQKRIGVKIPPELKNMNKESIIKYIPGYGKSYIYSSGNLYAIEQIISNAPTLFNGPE